jgi:hypothetical protein
MYMKFSWKLVAVVINVTMFLWYVWYALTSGYGFGFFGPLPLLAVGYVLYIFGSFLDNPRITFFPQVKEGSSDTAVKFSRIRAAFLFIPILILALFALKLFIPELLSYTSH